MLGSTLGGQEDLPGEAKSEMCSKDEWVLIRPRMGMGRPRENECGKP